MNVSELKAGREARIKENGIKGELYYCERCDRWFVLHNGNAIGNTPLDWDFIKKDKGYKNSWQISDPGSKTTNYVVVMQSNAVCMDINLETPYQHQCIIDMQRLKMMALQQMGFFFIKIVNFIFYLQIEILMDWNRITGTTYKKNMMLNILGTFNIQVVAS